MLAALLLAGGLRSAGAQTVPPATGVKAVRIADGVVLHYTEQGRGVPIVFVHGSLVDSTAWNRELTVFSAD